uniref:Uncharacterized protein n=1 Tax=Arundo donax TaxID=35708 RepID=A0A0A9T426_ARUDO
MICHNVSTNFECHIKNYSVCLLENNLGCQ